MEHVQMYLEADYGLQAEPAVFLNAFFIPAATRRQTGAVCTAKKDHNMSDHSIRTGYCLCLLASPLSYHIFSDMKTKIYPILSSIKTLNC